MTRIARLPLALVLTSIALAVGGYAWASGGIPGTTPLPGVTAQAGSTSAVVSWQVRDVPSTISIEYGVDDRYGVWSLPTTVLEARAGQTTLTGLEPGRTYRFH